MRAITGMPSLIKADAQATLFAPNNFLAMHDDRGTGEEGRQVAYVLSLAREWRPTGAAICSSTTMTTT